MSIRSWVQSLVWSLFCALTDSVSKDDSDWFSKVGKNTRELDDEGWCLDNKNMLQAYEFSPQRI